MLRVKKRPQCWKPLTQRKQRQVPSHCEEQEQSVGRGGALAVATSAAQGQHQRRQWHRGHEDRLLMDVPRQHKKAEARVDEARGEAPLRWSAPKLDHRWTQRQPDQCKCATRSDAW